MPVKFGIAPARALAYSPFGSRRIHSPIGVSTNTSMNSCDAAISRAICRSARNGEEDLEDHARTCVAYYLGTSPTAEDVRDGGTMGKADLAMEPVPHIGPAKQHPRRADRHQFLLGAVGDRQSKEPTAEPHSHL